MKTIITKIALAAALFTSPAAFALPMTSLSQALEQGESVTLGVVTDEQTAYEANGANRAPASFMEIIEQQEAQQPAAAISAELREELQAEMNEMEAQ